MNTTTTKEADVLRAIQAATFIVVVGGAATGKTTLTKDVECFHTDDYMRYAFDKSLYVLIEDIVKVVKREPSDKKIIVEGVQGFRLLRKIWQQNWKRKPDLVIHCVADVPTRTQRLLKRGSNPRQSIAFDGMLLKVWKDWQALVKQPLNTVYYDTSNRY